MADLTREGQPCAVAASSSASGLAYDASVSAAVATNITMDSLPFEITGEILNNVSDLTDLDALIRASPDAFRVFLTRPTHYLACALDNSDTYFEVRTIIEIVSLLRAGKLDLKRLPDRKFPTTLAWIYCDQLELDSIIADHLCLERDQYLPMAEHDLTVSQAISLLAIARRLAMTTQDCLKYYLDRFSAVRHNGLETPNVPNWKRLLDPNDNDPKIQGHKEVYAKTREIGVEHEKEKPYLAPPEYIEETRVSRALWRIHSYFEMRRALKVGSLKWSEKDKNDFFYYKRSALSYMVLDDGMFSYIYDREPEYSSALEENRYDFWPSSGQLGPDGLEARSCLEYLGERFPEAVNEHDLWPELMNQPGELHRHWPHMKPGPEEGLDSCTSQERYSEVINGKEEMANAISQAKAHNFPLDTVIQLTLGSDSYYMFTEHIYVEKVFYGRRIPFYIEHESKRDYYRVWSNFTPFGISFWANRRVTYAGLRANGNVKHFRESIEIVWNALTYWLREHGGKSRFAREYCSWLD